MPKKKNKQEKVYDYLLEFFQNRHEERHTFKKRTNNNGFKRHYRNLL